ncbi:MAG: thiosulfate sulfurtransferase [Deltaproteobacteria bacterium]|nr:thiosulfate sulfurtransferase [Deltaproteobacteria bacterium]MBW2153208.1 thiosulfate sulfurtransferase [Deltaproteobacteria bacterium]
MTQWISAGQLVKIIKDEKEFAIVDVREQGDFSKAHILLSSCIPLSRMELEVTERIPRVTTRIILVDDGPLDPLGLAERAVERLRALGYDKVSVLEGGIDGWRNEGLELYSGVNVLSKAFGEFVETTYHTTHITAPELKVKLEQGENLIVFDARPREEYHRMSIPGAINVPGGELVYRFFETVQDSETHVIINCAGRTRSIIGAQSLINAGVPNPVFALKNGTMGWHLAGFHLEHHQDRTAPIPSANNLEKARAHVTGIVERFGVKRIDYRTLESWMKNADERTVYVLDVRLPEEYESARLEGSRNAPGGQLIQATDEYMAVRNARVVLVDDNEIRAVMAASWLIQMGWPHVFVLSGGITTGELIQGSQTPKPPEQRNAPGISVAELRHVLDSHNNSVLIDFATSRQYQDCHIPSAVWIIRSRLQLDIKKISDADMLILTSPDGVLADLAAADMNEMFPDIPVRILEGGTRAWIKAGLPTESGMMHALSPVCDVWYKPYESKDAAEKAMKAYLDWEVALIDQIRRDDTIPFRAYPRRGFSGA